MTGRTPPPNIALVNELGVISPQWYRYFVRTETEVVGSEPAITGGTTGQYWRGDKSWQTLNKSAVGLGSVDNTADAAKNVLSATKLTTARTIGMTGDLVWTSPSFDGTGNVTAAGTLATVNANVGSFGSSTLVPVITVNAKGLITAVTTAAVSGGGGLSDGDYGDIVVSGTGTVMSFDTGVVTAFARTFLDDATAGDVRTTLGLGTAAVEATGTSGHVLPFADGVNTWGGAQTISPAGSTTTAQLTFGGATIRWINYGTTGFAAPAFTTRSAGTKIVLYNSLSGAAVDYALGIESAYMWFSTSATSTGFRWYGGTTIAATLTGLGLLTTISGVQASGSAGVGYATGAGGTVTQATSKSTGVTLDKVCGQITMNNAALANGTTASFVLTNNTIAATDVVVIAIASGGSIGYQPSIATVAAGSCTIQIRNQSGGSLSEAIVINFAVIKAVTS